VVVNPYVPKTQQTSQEPAEKVAAVKMMTNPFYRLGEENVSVPRVQINPYATSRVDLAQAE
jgi:hypothetical protein